MIMESGLPINVYTSNVSYILAPIFVIFLMPENTWIGSNTLILFLSSRYPYTDVGVTYI